MSRTERDRPYWVMLNDKNIVMDYYHDHGAVFQSGLDAYAPHSRYTLYCDAYEEYTWNSWNTPWQYPNPRPCRRGPILHKGGYWKFPHRDRINKHRPRRRDFLKKQVKVFNSHRELHDNYEFMNDDVYEPLMRESSHSLR